ncbi:MAG: hypothetical protein R3214_11905 [Christiangramia sp.]|nr:hypothetical protein [Christiangramia sp.]
MKTLINQAGKIVVLGLFTVLAACSPEEETSKTSDLSVNANDDFIAQRNGEKVTVFKGPEVQYGSGKARSWISINEEGFPVEIGIELTQAVLSDLSLLPDGLEISTVLPLHQKAKELTPFEHLAINFQEHGHGPIFWAEHFDFHFYTITNKERLAIPKYDANDQTIVDAFNYFPDMTKMPSDYFRFPGEGGTMQMMGKHWPPKNFETYVPFKHIMILGTYDQKNVFIEPMITVDYLLSGDEFSGDYSQPQTFEEPGNNYPTKYNIYHDGKKNNIYITLSDFVTR